MLGPEDVAPSFAGRPAVTKPGSGDILFKIDSQDRVL